MKHFAVHSGRGTKVGFRSALLAFSLLFTGAARAEVLAELFAYQATLTNGPSPPAGDFCNSVAIDGDTVVFGGIDVGAAHVYVQRGVPWAYPTWDLEAVLTPSGSASQFGKAVAISGNVVAIGNPAQDNKRGAVYTYQRAGSSWTFLTEVVAGGGLAGDNFGRALALDGDTLVVGAPGTSTSYRETAFVFVKQGDNWVQQKKLTAADPAAGNDFGCAVAVDGDTIVVGADGEGTGRTAAYVFVRPAGGTNWTQQRKLQAADYEAGDGFGRSVAVDGDTVAVGAEYHSDGGAVYVFARTNSVWGQPQKLVVSGEFSLGRTVDLSGQPLVAGNGLRLFVFTRDGTQWVLRGRPTDTEPSEARADAFAVSGDTIVVGWRAHEVASGPVVTYAPHYANPAALATAVRRLLYFPDAGGQGSPGAEVAAFRYRHLLFGPEANGLRAQFENMTDYYGAPERARAADAEDHVWRGLSLHPTNVDLGQLLLDIYYDRTVAESLLIRDLLEGAGKARFGPPLAPPAPTGGFLIDNEILQCRQAKDLNRSLIDGYSGLFTRAMVPQTPAGEGEPDATLGTGFFRELVPGRGLDPATYVTNGVSVPVVTNATLFAGYKDLVLVFDLLRDHARFTETLGRLLIGRNGPGDRHEASRLVGEARRFLFLQGSLLQNLFHDLPPAGDASAVAETITGWSASLDRLVALEPVLAGDQNVLGFTPDFLMLVEKYQGPNPTVFNSFDSLRERLSLASTESPLLRARERLDDARAVYGQYRGYQDQLAAQMDDMAGAIEDRLFQIVGARPGSPDYSDNPTNNPGSDLDQQYRSADVARLQIQRNQAAMASLNEQVQIELDLIAATNEVTLRYGRMGADAQRVLDIFNGGQGFFNEISDWGSITVGKDPSVSVNPGKFFGSVWKWAASAGRARREQELAFLAADQQAEIAGLQIGARVKTILLEMRTLLVDAQSAALTLEQELNRLAALYREKADLEARLAENGQQLASRFFADPLHRLAAESTQVRANLAFDEAQQWLYFAARACEYKWNLAFTNWSYGDKTWSLASLFALRNADELEDFYDALVAYDASINRAPDDAYDWFSVREDFLGLKRLDGQGQPAVYTDPVTGEALDAIRFFRTNLVRRLTPVFGGQEVVLEFNTVRQLAGSTFFVGPAFDLEGNVVSPGRFLDKIGWVKIQLLGPTNRTQLAGTLTYGGTSFLRNLEAGRLAPEHPDQLLDEMTAYSTRYWFYDPIRQQWRSTEGMTLSGVPMEVMADPDIPPSVHQIEELKERSVAATGWVLRIPTVAQGVRVLDLDDLDDVRFYFYHYSVSRH